MVRKNATQPIVAGHAASRARRYSRCSPLRIGVPRCASPEPDRHRSEGLWPSPRSAVSITGTSGAPHKPRIDQSSLRGRIIAAITRPAAITRVDRMLFDGWLRHDRDMPTQT